MQSIADFANLSWQRLPRQGLELCEQCRGLDSHAGKELSEHFPLAEGFVSNGESARREADA